MDKLGKVIIAAVIVAAAGLLILDGKLGEGVCGENSYDQTTGKCIEGGR